MYTDWRFRVSGGGTMNVAYDLWLHDMPNPDWQNNLVGRGWTSNTKYLSSIQAGTGVFTGNGQLDTDAYTADIR